MLVMLKKDYSDVEERPSNECIKHAIHLHQVNKDTDSQLDLEAIYCLKFFSRWLYADCAVREELWNTALSTGQWPLSVRKQVYEKARELFDEVAAIVQDEPLHGFDDLTYRSELEIWAEWQGVYEDVAEMDALRRDWIQPGSRGQGRWGVRGIR